MSGILEYSSTPASNTSVNGIAITGSSSLTLGDDAIRQIMADSASAITRNVTKAAGTYSAAKADYNQLWRATGAVTINLTAAATLTDGWCLWVKADGGNVTIDPSGSETIDGTATLTLLDGSSACIRCTGTAFVSVIFSNTVDALSRHTDFWLSNNVSDATNDIDITDQKGILATLTKRLDGAWAVGSGQGGLDTGAIANTTYHVWLIRRPDTGVVDALFSTSATSPTMPTNYTQKRRIGSIIRESAAIVAFFQIGDIFKRAPVVTASGTTAVGNVFLAFNVPTGIVVQPIIAVTMTLPASSRAANWLGDAASSAVSANVVDVTAAAAATASAGAVVSGGFYTNTSAQLLFSRTIAGGSVSTNSISTIGWIDTRGRDA